MAKVSSESRKIVLGVSGGIAVYKAADLVRRLIERGYDVQVVMTASARKFVQPLTFAALTGRKVITELFSESSEESTLQSAVEHVGVAEQADLLLVAPATAAILARFAHGIADDFLSTMYLAYAGPVLVAPAMNTNMWHHAATKENVAALKRRGVRFIEPDSGSLACGTVGPGRLADNEAILEAVESVFALPDARNDLDGETVLITAGPTQEPLDPVRFVSNRSSGRMGYALATEALARGARVILISGPVALEPPAGCELVSVGTAAEMHQAVLRRLKDATIVIAAAAVADYRPRRAAEQKMKKTSGVLPLEFEPTADILAEVGRLKGRRFLVGFAAETENVVEQARSKLASKNCDLMVANPVGEAAGGAGMESDENQGWLIDAGGEVIELARMAKRRMALRILDRVRELQGALESTR
jgi:phosphopantothenoylcysteine decarboxylase/phosphopantothenate--cysteine ligase